MLECLEAVGGDRSSTRDPAVAWGLYRSEPWGCWPWPPPPRPLHHVLRLEAACVLIQVFPPNDLDAACCFDAPRYSRLVMGRSKCQHTHLATRTPPAEPWRLADPSRKSNIGAPAIRQLEHLDANSTLRPLPPLASWSDLHRRRAGAIDADGLDADRSHLWPCCVLRRLLALPRRFCCTCGQSGSSLQRRASDDPGCPCLA